MDDVDGLAAAVPVGLTTSGCSGANFAAICCVVMPP